MTPKGQWLMRATDRVPPETYKALWVCSGHKIPFLPECHDQWNVIERPSNPPSLAVVPTRAANAGFKCEIRLFPRLLQSPTKTNISFLPSFLLFKTLSTESTMSSTGRMSQVHWWFIRLYSSSSTTSALLCSSLSHQASRQSITVILQPPQLPAQSSTYTSAHSIFLSLLPTLTFF